MGCLVALLPVAEYDILIKSENGVSGGGFDSLVLDVPPRQLTNAEGRLEEKL